MLKKHKVILGFCPVERRTRTDREQWVKIDGSPMEKVRDFIWSVSPFIYMGKSSTRVPHNYKITTICHIFCNFKTSTVNVKFDLLFFFFFMYMYTYYFFFLNVRFAFASPMSNVRWRVLNVHTL